MERGKRDETKRGERGVCSDTTRWGEVVPVVPWQTGPALLWPVGSGLPSERPPDSQSPQTRNLNTKTHTHSEVIDSEFAECVCVNLPVNREALPLQRLLCLSRMALVDTILPYLQGQTLS